MKISIQIECETIGEFNSHLSELRRQIKNEAKRRKLSEDDEFTSAVDLDDNNCYGTHEVYITSGEPHR